MSNDDVIFLTTWTIVVALSTAAGLMMGVAQDGFEVAIAGYVTLTAFAEVSGKDLA